VCVGYIKVYEGQCNDRLLCFRRFFVVIGVASSPYFALGEILTSILGVCHPPKGWNL
jgi:hypothetical protein